MSSGNTPALSALQTAQTAAGRQNAFGEDTDPSPAHICPQSRSRPGRGVRSTPDEQLLPFLVDIDPVKDQEKRMHSLLR